MSRRLIRLMKPTDMLRPTGALFVIVMLALVRPAHGAQTGYSATHLYNEANAYARSGQPGRAVLDYERAGLLAPGDSDIGANLAAVRQSQHLSGAPRSVVVRMLLWPTPSSVAVIGEIGLLLLGAAALAGVLGVLSRNIRWMSAALGALLLSSTVGQGLVLWPTLDTAVVIAHEARVLESPVPMAATTFAIPEALTVSVTATHDNYLLIRLPDGRSGWVSAASVARVVPTR